VREATAEAIGKIGLDSSSVIPPLARALSDPDEAVRTSTADALANIGPSSIH